jgi:hypothetical protein
MGRHAQRRISRSASWLVAVLLAAGLGGPQAVAAEPVDLPSGWTVAAAPAKGVSRIAIEGTTDTVMAGTMPYADARKLVTALAAQMPPGYALVTQQPVKQANDGTVIGGAKVSAPDGSRAAKIVVGFALPDGRTAIVALFTADLERQSLGEKSRSLTAVLAQLKAGRGFGITAPVSVATSTKNTATQPLPKYTGSTALPANIDSIGVYPFAGGFAVDYRPVILYKNGVMCDCMEYGFGVTNIEALKAKHPADFGRWRRVGSRIDYVWDDSKDRAWSELSGGKLRPLPDNWRTRGTYRRINSVGMGENMTSSTSMLTFAPDGRFSKGAVISSTASSGDTSVFAGGESAKYGGRYHLTGWYLTLAFDDGTVQRKTVAWQSDQDVLWIDGSSFIR